MGATGDRWAGGAASMVNTDEMPEGVCDDASWSTVHREHMKRQHIRHDRRRAQEKYAAPLPPAYTPQTKVPEKFECTPFPDYGHVEKWFEDQVITWRLVTAGYEHAEEYFRKVWTLAKKARKLSEKDPQRVDAFESLRCDYDGYLQGEEKLPIALRAKLTGSHYRRWELLCQQRRAEGMPSPQGRQLLFWILSGWVTAGENEGSCLAALMALRDA